MKRYRLTRAARRDLLNIGAFYAEVNPAAGQELIHALLARLWVLNALPGLGRVRADLEGLHAFPVKSHLIIYRPYADGIEVIRILHQRRDVRELLRRK